MVVQIVLYRISPSNNFIHMKVWEESSGESLLQMQLLIALKNFVVALGYQSPICYNILLPILQRGIDVNGPDELNLMEDSMVVSLYLILQICTFRFWNAHECSWYNVSCSCGKLHLHMRHRWFHSYWTSSRVLWISLKEVLITWRLDFLHVLV